MYTPANTCEPLQRANIQELLLYDNFEFSVKWPDFSLAGPNLFSQARRIWKYSPIVKYLTMGGGWGGGETEIGFFERKKLQPIETC